MDNGKNITQICVVVEDVQKINANWARVLGEPLAEIVTIFPDGIYHFTHGDAVDYRDCQVAKYELEGFILELIQPGETPSPWRTFLEKHGQGVFHFCIFVDDRKVFQQTLSNIGVGFPYHVGYFPGGSYQYVDSRDALGLELSVNHLGENGELIEDILQGRSLPLDELK